MMTGSPLDTARPPRSSRDGQNEFEFKHHEFVSGKVANSVPIATGSQLLSILSSA
jgi:hypothetical protein